MLTLILKCKPMKPFPTQQRAVRKRSALLAAAINEFSSDGFEVATAKSIAARAGVATGTFYQYFDNKNDILCVIASERYGHLQKVVQFQEPRSLQTSSLGLDVEQIFTNVLNFLYDFHTLAPQLHQVLEQRRNIDPELQKVMDAGEQVLRERVGRFVQLFDFDEPEAVAQNLFAMAEGLVHSVAFDGARTPVSKAIPLGAAMLAAYFTQHRMQTH